MSPATIPLKRVLRAALKLALGGTLVALGLAPFYVFPNAPFVLGAITSILAGGLIVKLNL